MHNEDLETYAELTFIASAALTLIEIVYFYFMKVKGINLEVNVTTGKPRAKNKFVRGFGFCTVLFAAIAVITGIYSYDDQGCLDKWFVDETNLCKSCTLFFGEECLDCADSTKCTQC